jgi:hypothetical protein
METVQLKTIRCPADAAVTAMACNGDVSMTSDPAPDGIPGDRKPDCD